MKKKKYLKTIKKILIKDMKKNVKNNNLDLIKSEILDSLNYIKFVNIIEKKFKMEFNLDDLSKLKKFTINSISIFLEKNNK